MPNMDLKTVYTMRMSLDSIEEYEKMLTQRKKDISKIAENIVKRVLDVGLEDNYNSSEIIPVTNDGNVVSGGIQTTDEIDTYREFGTGIVGSENPHIADFLAKVGWKYDVNEHGEKGWIYPKDDGTFGWTRGLPSEKKFYEALLKMRDILPEIAKEELQK